jgi:hypothetical protein
MFPSVDGRLAILAILLASLVVIKAFARFIVNRQNKPCLPPGPVPLPLLGNILSIDVKEPWLTYTEWRATYGTWEIVWCICGANHYIRRLGFRATSSRPGSCGDQFSAHCRSLDGQAFSYLLRSTIRSHNRTVRSLNILTSNHYEV